MNEWSRGRGRKKVKVNKLYLMSRRESHKDFNIKNHLLWLKSRRDLLQKFWLKIKKKVKVHNLYLKSRHE